LESGKSPNKAADGPATGRNRNGMEREESGVFCPLPVEFFVGFVIESLNKDSPVTRVHCQYKILSQN